MGTPRKRCDESGAYFMVRTCAPQSPAQHPRFFELVAEGCFCMLCIVVGVLSQDWLFSGLDWGLEKIADTDHAAFLQ